MKYTKKDSPSTQITTTGKTATNKYGNKLVWVILSNGHTDSIWESELITDWIKG